MSQARVKLIPTLERHYRAFAFKHPMEIPRSEVARNDTHVLTVERREIFRYESQALGTFLIDVSSVKKALSQRRLRFRMFEMELTKEWADYIFEYGGCEEPRIASLTPSDLRRPGINLMLDPDGGAVMIDGNHRLVRRWREGLTTFTIASVILPDVVPFIAGDNETEKLFMDN